MDKKPEITIQYFIDRGRRRTVTVSVKRLQILLVSGLAFCFWSAGVTGFLVYHAATGQSPFIGAGKGKPSVIAVSPDQPERPVTIAKVGNTEVRLAAKSGNGILSNPTETEQPAAVTPTPAEPDKMGVTAPKALSAPQEYLASLASYEADLKQMQEPAPLRFANIRHNQSGDHLRVVADIEKVSGAVVEGHAFIVAEFVSPNGEVTVVTSHGKKDWNQSIEQESFKSGIYFKARMRTHKRFDVVSPVAKSAQLRTVRLVARDRNSGRIVVEEITPEPTPQ